MIWEVLHELGWVDFTVANATISRFFDEVGSGVPVGSDADLAATDLIHLTAAELALPRGLRDTPSDGPFFLNVPKSAARLAAFSSDCGPFKTHNPREKPRLWDVTLFGSDASKLAWLADTDSVETLAERFVPAVMRLGDMYDDLSQRRTDRPDDHGPTAWRPEVFAVRATLWRAKIGVLLRDEDPVNALEEVHAAASGGTFA